MDESSIVVSEAQKAVKLLVSGGRRPVSDHPSVGQIHLDVASVDDKSQERHF